MSKIFVIAVREYNAAIKSKAFIISLILMPVMMFAGIGVQMIVAEQVDDTVRKYAIVDRTPNESLIAFLTTAARSWNESERFDPKTRKPLRPSFALTRIPPSPANSEAIKNQRLDLCNKIRDGSFEGILEIGGDAINPRLEAGAITTIGPDPLAKNRSDERILRYQTNRPTSRDFPKWAEAVVNLAIQIKRFENAKISWREVQSLVSPVPLVSKGLTSIDPKTRTIDDAPDSAQIAPFLVPFFLVMLMFMVVLIGATPLLQGTVEEKSARIAEVLLGSVAPFPLMLGKLLGTAGVSLTMLAVYLGGGAWALVHFGWAEYLTVSICVWFVVYQIMAVFLYGSIFAAVGAACSDLKETQAMITPVMLVICLPMFALGPILMNPDGALATTLSLFPLSTPMLMIARQAVPPGVPYWQSIVGIVGTLAATIACVFLSGRVFRVGLLMQGKSVKPSDMIKWALRA